MSSNNPFEIIEVLNEEYLRLSEAETPEIRLAKMLSHFKENFPFHILQWIKAHHEWNKKEALIQKISTSVSKDDLVYATGVPVEDKRGVIYSCVTGGYDAPYEPLLISDSLDYKLYTDAEQKEDSVWKKQSINLAEVKIQDNSPNRYYKFHPYDLFKEYDYSIYIDGNVQVISDLTCLYREAHKSPIGIAMHRHAHRDCGYLDAKWCEYNRRGKLENMALQIQKYRQEGFPENFGLCEATIIVVDLHNQTGHMIMDAWWKEFLRAGSGRDQMAFPYVLWKNGYKIEDVGFLGNDEYHNPKFRIYAHKGKLF